MSSVWLVLHFVVNAMYLFALYFILHNALSLFNNMYHTVIMQRFLEIILTLSLYINLKSFIPYAHKVLLLEVGLTPNFFTSKPLWNLHDFVFGHFKAKLKKIRKFCYLGLVIKEILNETINTASNDREKNLSLRRFLSCLRNANCLTEHIARVANQLSK